MSYLYVVSTPPPIELIEVAGASHREIGSKVGSACADQIGAAIAASQADLPPDRDMATQLELASRYRETTAATLPWLVEELDATAEGAGVDALAFFACGIEEIWYEPRLPKGRCSDLVAGPRATENGHVIVGHNNDLYPSSEEPIVAIERRIRGKPVVFSIGVGPWPSVGFNSSGISFTGNELSPNDERIGVPRLPQFLAMLYQDSVASARELALLPTRASSYNHVIASRDGHVFNLEGSATDAEITGTDGSDVFAHTNHYACERMLPYEGDDDYAAASEVRRKRAHELLLEQAGRIAMASMREMLSDHATDPALCRHVASDAQDASKTVFWTVTDVSEMRITFGRGNPCDSLAQTYAF